MTLPMKYMIKIYYAFLKDLLFGCVETTDCKYWYSLSELTCDCAVDWLARSVKLT